METTEKNKLFDKINSTLNQVRPYLQADGGDISLIETFASEQQAVLWQPRTYLSWIQKIKPLLSWKEAQKIQALRKKKILKLIQQAMKHWSQQRNHALQKQFSFTRKTAIKYIRKC